MAQVEYRLHKGDTVQPYWWTVRSTGNGKTLAKSENYNNRKDAIAAADLVHNDSAGSEFFDFTGD